MGWKFNPIKFLDRVEQTDSSDIDHDQTTNYVANEHIDWTQASAGTIHESNLDIDANDLLLYWQETQSTENINSTVHVKAWEAQATSTNADAVVKPKGTGAFILANPDATATGGNKRGAYAVDLQTARASATQVASGIRSLVAGSNNTASGYASTAFGDGNTSSAQFSTTIGRANSNDGDIGFVTGNQNSIVGFCQGATCIGNMNTSNANYATCIGDSNTASEVSTTCIGANNTASAEAATAIGKTNTTAAEASLAIGRDARIFRTQGKVSQSSQLLSSAGDNQSSRVRMRVFSNKAGTYEMLANSSTTTGRLFVEDSQAFYFKGMLIAKQQGSTTNVACWDVEGLIAKGTTSASTSLIYSNVTTISNTPGWTNPTLSANTTDGSLSYRVTGVAGTNIYWSSHLDTTEVIY